MTDRTALDLATAYRPPRSQWRDVWDQFRTHKGALVGAAFFLLLLLGVVLGPYLWTVDPQ